MKLTLAAVAVAALALGGSAHAGPDPFVQFVADVASGSADADKWFGDCDVLIAPGGQVRHPCTIARADLVADAKATLAVTANKVSDLELSQYEYRDATGRCILLNVFMRELGRNDRLSLSRRR